MGLSGEGRGMGLTGKESEGANSGGERVKANWKREVELAGEERYGANWGRERGGANWRREMHG